MLLRTLFLNIFLGVPHPGQTPEIYARSRTICYGSSPTLLLFGDVSLAKLVQNKSANWPPGVALFLRDFSVGRDRVRRRPHVVRGA